MEKMAYIAQIFQKNLPIVSQEYTRIFFFNICYMPNLVKLFFILWPLWLQHKICKENTIGDTLLLLINYNFFLGFRNMFPTRLVWNLCQLALCSLKVIVFLLAKTHIAFSLNSYQTMFMLQNCFLSMTMVAMWGNKWKENYSQVYR